jgi:hypothetical protein
MHQVQTLFYEGDQKSNTQYAQTPTLCAWAAEVPLVSNLNLGLLVGTLAAN